MTTLFSKGQIGKMKLKNRVFMAPMGTTGEADGSYTQNAINYFEERAKGGTGLIITGANIASTKYEPRPCTELSGFHNVENLAVLIERCHHHGAKVCVQISPGLGRMVFTDPFTPPYSASECQSFWFEDLKCKPLEVEDIKYLTEKMAYTASLAQAAGADAVEIHGYGGYLLDQFHSTLWNKRTDEYGGSLENRLRFTLEIIQAIRATCGPDFPVIVKFTAVHDVDGGRELDEGIDMAKIFEKAGVDALHVDVGCYEAWYKAITTVYSQPAHQREVAAAIKRVVDVPVLGHGKFEEPVDAADVIASGDVDFVGLGHQLLADPLWTNKVKRGNLEDIVPCIGCNECLLSGFTGKHYYCAVNPLCYAEKDYQLTETTCKDQKVLVVGGGPGGMQAAITAAERGFDVELLERSHQLGGNLWAAGLPSFKAPVLKLIEYMKTQLYKGNVQIRLNKSGTAEEIINNDYDKVILATGSAPVTPPIEGVETAVFAGEVLTGKKKAAGKVIVIGGGLVGCETALLCKETAEQVTIIEVLDDILVTTNHSRNNEQHLRALISENNIAVQGNTKVKRIESNQVIVEKDGEIQIVDCDLVILACGYVANNPLELELEGHVKSLNVIGDADNPNKIIDAVHQGYHAIRLMA